MLAITSREMHSCVGISAIRIGTVNLGGMMVKTASSKEGPGSRTPGAGPRSSVWFCGTHANGAPLQRKKQVPRAEAPGVFAAPTALPSPGGHAPYWPVEILRNSPQPQQWLINNENTPRPLIAKYLGVEFSEPPNDLAAEVLPGPPKPGSRRQGPCPSFPGKEAPRCRKDGS